MLISFTVGNYLSFKDRTTLSLQASTVRELRETNVFHTGVGDISLVKGGALYGPNSSGKSNLLKSLAFMTRFICTSAESMRGIEAWPENRFKLSTSTLNKPSYFQIEFIYNNTAYKYQFEIDDKNIVSESLWYRRKVTEALIFTRKGSEIIIEEKFKTAEKAKEYTRSNALFLSTASLLNVDWAIELIKAFDKFRYLHMRVPSTIGFGGIAGSYYDESSKYKKQIEKLLVHGHLGFEKVATETINIKPETTDSNIASHQKFFFSESKVKLILTLHNQLDEKGDVKSQVAFELDEESDGTKKYFSLLSPILETLSEGRVLFVDEFTSHLHPVLAENLIKLFHNPKINKGNGQLIIATHNTYLLNEELYRKDQIYFTEKNRLYSTKLTRLNEHKDLRQDANFEKRYIHDRQLGAIPKKWSLNETEFWK